MIPAKGKSVSVSTPLRHIAKNRAKAGPPYNGVTSGGHARATGCWQAVRERGHRSHRRVGRAPGTVGPPASVVASLSMLTKTAPTPSSLSDSGLRLIAGE